MGQVDLDTDNNGLVDTWEIRFFGSKGQDKDADPDGDGENNLQECIAHTNPLDGKDCFMVVQSEFDADDALVTFSSVVGKNYRIQVSNNLSGWNSIEGATPGTPLDFYGSGGIISVDFSTPASPVALGGVSREVWLSVPAPGTSDLKAFFDGAGQAAGKEWRATLKGPSNYGDNFGARYSGYIVPKESGNYTFSIAGRGVCELHLNSTGESPGGTSLVAEIDSDTLANGVTEEEDWDYLSSLGETDTQTSGTFNLTAGSRYYFEVHHVARTGADHVAVGWTTPSSGSTIEVVPGDCLSPEATYTSSNAASLLSGPRTFVRVQTFAPGDPNALDSDGDGIDDASENDLIPAGFSPFSGTSFGSGTDVDNLLPLINFDPLGGDKEEVSITVTDNESIELQSPPLLPGRVVDLGNLGSLSGDTDDKIRFRITRSQGLEPVTVYYTLGGGTVMGEVGATRDLDYSAPSGDMVTIPALATGVDVELTVKRDNLHEYPETVSCTLDTHSDYDIAGGAAQAKAEICDMPGDVNILFVGAYEPDYNAAPGSTSANGTLSGYLKGDKRSFVLRNDNFGNLSSPQNDTHIHKANLVGGQPTAGPAIRDILNSQGVAWLGHYLTFHWELTDQNPVLSTNGGTPSRQVVIDSLFNQNGETPLYVNLHTDGNAAGETMARLEPATGSVNPPDPPADPGALPLLTGADLELDIVRFLNQATFGAVAEDVVALKSAIETERQTDPTYSRIEEFGKWIDNQVKMEQTFLLDFVLAADNLEWNLRGMFDPAEWQDWDAARPGNDATPFPHSWPHIDRSLTNGPAPGMGSPGAAYSETKAHPFFYANQWFPVGAYPVNRDWVNWRDDDTAGEGSKVTRNLGENNADNRRRAHWTMMVNAKDQLRHKWGYALQQILVVSETTTQTRNQHLGASNYQDMLNYYGLPSDRNGNQAIDNDEKTYFRDLIGYINWSPMMGYWLSSLKNRAAYDSNNDGIIDVYPDENLAREDMQLFTIGLFNLWSDGSLQLQTSADPNTPPGSSATYTNDDIQEFARVLTGQSFSRYVNDSRSPSNPANVHPSLADRFYSNPSNGSAYGFREGPYQWGITALDLGEVFDTNNNNGGGSDGNDQNNGNDGIRYVTQNQFTQGIGEKYYTHTFNYPMRMFGKHTNGTVYHDLGVKTIVGGRVIDNRNLLSNQSNPANSSNNSIINMGVRDIEDALDWLAGKVDGNAGPDFTGDAGNPASSHASTPPFICRRLVQRMTTSNPSSAYLYRVTEAFKNSEGCMIDVCKAILLDHEARNIADSDTFGIKKSPLEGYIQMLRSFDAHSLLPIRNVPGDKPFDGSFPQVEGGYDPGSYSGHDQYHKIFLTDYGYPASQADNFRQNCHLFYPNTDGPLSMTPFAQETVFNFYLPDYSSGVVQSAALVSPELQLATETNVVDNHNYFWTVTWSWDGNRDRRQEGQYVNTFGDSTRNQREAFAPGHANQSGDWDHHHRVRIPMQKWADLIYDSAPFVARNIAGSGGRSGESLEDEALVDFIDRRLTGGRFKARYPFLESDDEDSLMDGNLIRSATYNDGNLTNDKEKRNPREWIIHTLTDTFGDGSTSDSNRLNKFRTALYLFSQTPEYQIQD